MSSSNIDRLTRRKRQTRLKFDAISPTTSTSDMSLAKVRYELPGKQKQNKKLSPAASQEAEDTESDDVLNSTNIIKPVAPAGRSPFNLLPTPIRSSQVQSNGSISRSSNTEVVVYSSPDTSRDKLNLGNPALNKRVDTPEGSEPEPTPTKPRSHKRRAPLMNDSEEDMFSAKSKVSHIRTQISPKLATKGKSLQEPITLSELSEDEITLPARKPRKSIFGNGRGSSSKRSKQPLDLDSDSDSDLIISSPKRSQRPTFKPKRPTALEDSDEDIRPSSSKRNRSLIEDDTEDDRLPFPLKRRRPQGETDDEDADLIVSPLKHRRPQVEAEEDDDDDDEVLSSSKRHRSGRGRGKKSSVEDSESEEATPKRFTRQQKVKRHRTEKEKQLEILKRKRAGEDIEKLTTSESESEEESEEELQKLSEFEDDDEELEDAQKLTKRNKPDSTEGFVLDDSDFIVEDDEAPLGILDYSLSMPLAFTHAAHKPLKEHFRDVVEWMIKNKIHPAFPRDDEVYNQAFRKLDDESSGLAKSKFSSSQWTKDFTVALYARPHISFGPLAEGEGFDPLSGRPKCDACNHRSHIPSFAIQFEGKAYDKRTLEELDQGNEEDSSDSDSDSSDDSDSKSYDSNGQPIPPEKTRWCSGRFCKANAELAHTLIHWKFSLNEWVVDSLTLQGYNTPEKLAERDKMKPKQLNKLANRILDDWVADGTIKDLYRDYKNQMTMASELKAHGKGGWK